MHYHLLILVVREHHDLTLVSHYLVVGLELVHFVSVKIVVSLLYLILLWLLLPLHIFLLVLDLLDKLVLLDHLGDLNMAQADWGLLGRVVQLLNQFLLDLPQLLLNLDFHGLHLLYLTDPLVVVSCLVLGLLLQELHGALWWHHLVLRICHHCRVDKALDLW